MEQDRAPDVQSHHPELAALHIRRAKFHGDRNYALLPIRA